MPANYKVTYGGWYQRTTLHLTEIYELLANANSYLDLSKDKLKEFRKNLDLKSITRELGYLEYVKAITNDGIELRYYEDGLYILEISTANIKEGKEKLENYFNQKLNPAISYIFSLGAPTPKVLANIKTFHPTVVSIDGANAASNTIDKSLFKDIYSKIEEKDVAVYKSKDYIFVLYNPSSTFSVAGIVEMQIFFREFKDQLEKYLYIHRKVWEEISAIKEKSAIRASDASIYRKKLDDYQKTISLISNRINQMGAYAQTRQSISKNIRLDKHLENLFQYRFEVLVDTLDYIKEIWKMTTDYVNSAIQVIVEIQNSATNRSIQSLTLITSVGVLAGLMGHLSRDAYPKVTLIGISYLALLILAGWMFNWAISAIQLNRKQKLKFSTINDTI